MTMRDAKKGREKPPPVNNPHPPAKEPLSNHELNHFLRNARADAIRWERLAKENQEAASQLTQVQQDIQTYQIEVNELKQIYLNEQKNYQQALCLYNGEKTRAIELIAQRDEWQERAKENQEAASQLSQVQQNIHTYQV
ncbi:MAG: hypothetical protein ACYTX0_30805, partial [Nostoc sp.]